jgi:hypothetical protein
MKQFHALGVAAIAAAGALAFPALAAAHPSVYKSEALIGAALTPETRYLVVNHGFPILFRETNGVEGTKGVVGYNLIPSAWRTGKPWQDVMNAGGTGVQVHATCVGAAALENETAIKSWQDADAFYNYVPFQTTSAGLEDDPATWLKTLSDAGVTTANLATEAGRMAECAALTGTYLAADLVQSDSNALTTGVRHPYEDEISELTTRNSTMTSQSSALSAQVATLTAGLAATQADLAVMKAANARLMLSAASMKIDLGAVKVSGTKATISGPPETKVTVRLRISSKDAKKLKLRSTTIARKSVRTGADGTATLTVKPSKSVARRLKGKPKVTAEATGGDRIASDSGKLTRR